MVPFLITLLSFFEPWVKRKTKLKSFIRSLALRTLKSSAVLGLIFDKMRRVLVKINCIVEILNFTIDALLPDLALIALLDENRW